MEYGTETRTVLRTDRKMIEAFEKWYWRKTLKIPWIEKVKNEEIYLRMKERKTIQKTII